MPRRGIQIIPSNRKRIIPENYPQYQGIKQTTEVTPISKKEIIIVVAVIILFIGIFAVFYQTGDKTNQTGNYDQINAEKNEAILSNYSIMDTSYKDNGNTFTESFSKNGISFNYPNSWRVYLQSSNIFALSNEKSDFQVQILNNNAYSIEDTIRQSQFVISDDWNKIASYKLVIDNETAYEDIYTFKDNESGILMRAAQIILVKNNKKYLIYLQAADKDFDEEKSNFAVILNSFKVNEGSEESNYLNPTENPHDENEFIVN